MSRIVHFDLPADDLERAKRFYSDIFDWKFSGIPGMDYYFIEQSGEGSVELKGGMGKRGAPGQGITNFLGVPSVDEYMSRIEGAGGKVIGGKQTVPGWGHMAVCIDTEGNTFGIWQEDKDSK